MRDVCMNMPCVRGRAHHHYAQKSIAIVLYGAKPAPKRAATAVRVPATGAVAVRPSPPVPVSDQSEPCRVSRACGSIRRVNARRGKGVERAPKIDG
jgi:hypothetical protein